MKKLVNLLLFISITCSILAFAGEAGTALKADVLRAEPFADAKSVGNLTKNDMVDILTKKGAWLQVKSKKTTGWVRLLSVKRGGVSKSNSVSGLASVVSGRAGSGKVVSTTGIRGLSAEELKAAKFNDTEIKKLESNQVSADEAKQFAHSGGLNSAPIAYLKGVR